MSVEIHPTAVVHPGAEIGEGSVVGPYCIIEDRVVLGKNTRMDAFSQVKSYTRMGEGNRVYSYALIGEEPQDLKFHGEDSWVEIGDNNRIREFVTIHRGTEGGAAVTRVGSGCLLMAYVHLAHDCILGNGVIMSNAASLAGHVDVGDNAIIGGMTGIHQFVRIGKNAFIGGMTGVGLDVPPFCLASGDRARLHGLNLVGLTRRGMPKEKISALKSAYKTIFRSNLDREQALAEVEQTLGQYQEVAEFLDFIRTSERGITPAAKGNNKGNNKD